MGSWSIGLLGALALSAEPVFGLQEAPPLPVVRIALVEDGPAGYQPSGADTVRQAVITALSGDFDVRFPEEFQLRGDWTDAGAREALRSVFAQPNVDLVIVAGPLGSNAVCNSQRLPKPVVALRVFDAALQGIPFRGPGSGVEQLSYLQSPLSLNRHLRSFLDVRGFKRLAVLVGDWVKDAAPKLIETVISDAAELGLEVQVVEVGRSSSKALSALRGDSQAVYLGPLLHLPADEFEDLVEGLIQRRLPSFSMLGLDDVRLGALACVGPAMDFERLARRAAQNVQRILLGEEPGSLPTAIIEGELLAINMATARAIGVWPRFELLTDAVLVGEPEAGAGRKLNISQVMFEAAEVNLELRHFQYNLNVGRELVRESEAALGTELDVGLYATWIDRERAQSPLGLAQRTYNVGLSARRVLYSEAFESQTDVERALQAGRVQDYEVKRLDVIRDAALSYLMVLRAKTAARIRREDLERSKMHWNLANDRSDMGMAGPAELLRWESQIATGESLLVEAEMEYALAQMALNQVLHRPLEEELECAETSLTDDAFLSSDPRLGRYIESPWAFAIFRDFAVEEGLAKAPELAEIDAAISAQERRLLSTERAFFSPTLAAEGLLLSNLATGGAKFEDRSANGIDVADPENLRWAVGLELSLPLASGGARHSRLRRARQKLIGLRLERQRIVESVELRVRAAMHRAGASFAKIELAREASRSAARNRELVNDAYARGIRPIVDLLDAQTAARRAEEASAKAVHEFLIHLVEMQRATSRFDVFATPSQREAWFGRVGVYFDARRDLTDREESGN